MNHPLVSVNIRTYNSDKTLEETLQSVINQSYKNIEIVVSDGFSTDRSAEIAKKYGARVQYAQKLGDARYQNFRRSRGRYIFSVDSDQILDPNLIETCLNLCEKKGYDALSISERSLIQKNTLVERLIAYDKWVIDKSRATDSLFGTACPRFFRKSVLKSDLWPKALSIFDDTILYAKLLQKGAKIGYVYSSHIHHYEVTSWKALWNKFYRYGKGYLDAFRELPLAVSTHSLPRGAYFNKAAFSKPHYWVGLLFLYLVKALAAALGMFSSLVSRQ